MGFKYSAIIENTLEAREWLHSIGVSHNPFDDELDENEWLIANYGMYISIRPIQEELLNYVYKTDINCLGNMPLFRAVTAVRDDSDYKQWFYWDDDSDEGDPWMLSEQNNFFEGSHNWWAFECHKATDKELINKFTKKENIMSEKSKQFYPKINTLYKRGEDKKIIIDDFSDPTVELLKDLKWDAEEKIDGTNISIHWDGKNVKFEGKTETAEIPKTLLKHLSDTFTKELLYKIFPPTEEVPEPKVILFGEGYGAKIQKGGNYIPNGVSFILFDVQIGNWWLLRDSVEDIGNKLGIDVVPYIGKLTIEEAERIVINGFKSKIAHNKDYDAEGLVLKAPMGLKGRDGKRLVVKIKTVDYRHLGL